MILFTNGGDRARLTLAVWQLSEIFVYYSTVLSDVLKPYIAGYTVRYYLPQL